VFAAHACQATSYHLGRLKAQLAKLRTELLNPAPGAGTGAKTGDGFEARPRAPRSVFSLPCTLTRRVASLSSR
jgi:hypothetical protein